MMRYFQIGGRMPTRKLVLLIKHTLQNRITTLCFVSYVSIFSREFITILKMMT